MGQAKINAKRKAEMETHFGCTVCGKCCNSQPEMSFIEGLHHIESFLMCAELFVLPMYVAHYGLRDNWRGQFVQPMEDRAMALGSPRIRGRAGEYHLTLAMFPLSVTGIGCQMLGPLEPGPHGVQAACTIYEDRPMTCLCNPLQMVIGSDDQGLNIKMLEQQVASGEWDCKLDASQPVIAKGRSIVDPVMRAAHDKGDAYERFDNEFLALIMGPEEATAKHYGLSLREDILSMLQTSARRLRLDTVVVLQILHALQAKGAIAPPLPLPAVAVFLETQIATGSRLLQRLNLEVHHWADAQTMSELAAIERQVESYRAALAKWR